MAPARLHPATLHADNTRLCLTNIGSGASMAFTRMNELDLKGKRVLIREDLNAPIKDGVVTSSQRLEAALPTLRQARDAGAKVMVLAHRGRPTEGTFDADASLQPVADWLGG